MASVDFRVGETRYRLLRPDEELLEDARIVFVEAHLAGCERGLPRDEELFLRIIRDDDWGAARYFEGASAEQAGVAARFELLLASCLVYASGGRRVFGSVEDYRSRRDEPVARAALEVARGAFG